MKLLAGLFFCAAAAAAQPESAAPLLGRWEVVAYAEQGVQVDKKLPAAPQALAVYRHVREDRGRQWYGYDPDDEQSRRRLRAYERWAERDSALEVERVADAIATPYYAVFFADSTLALYNKRTETNEVLFPEARRYVYSAKTSSIDIYAAGNYGYLQWNAQILLLTDSEMTLFLPEEAEIVRLRKTAFVLP